MSQNQWTEFLKNEFEEPYFQELSEFLKEEYASKKIYPPREQVFSCFNHTDYPDVKVVILGQDPYHQPHQAHGMCFSVLKGVKTPPSLVNIYKELNSDLGCAIPNHGYLMDWAKQGVFLLNTVLTVEDSKAFSHRNKGWETFTDHVLVKLNDHPEPLVFILWGKAAQDKIKYITNPKHCIIKSAHPSPLSAHNGFFGSRPFSKTNQFLEEHNRKPIQWEITS